MKKLVFASVMALASITLVSSPMLRAQDSITIKDPQEFNAYQLANTQSDAKTKAGQLEDFLTKYPQSVVKNAVLDALIDTYQSLNDADKTLSAASRLLQVDPNNMKAIFISVFIKKGQCAKTSDAQTCDDAAALATRGLAAPKPAEIKDDVWKNMTGGTYTAFHSAIALDDILSKKDFKAGILEYRTELMLYPADQTTKGPGLWDTLQLAEAYIKQEAIDAKAALKAAAAVKAATDPAAKAEAEKAAKDAKDTDGNDLVQAVWFYARAWNFAPASLKTPIEAKMKFYYTKYHGNVDGLDAVKTQSGATVFPPGTYVITAAATPAEIVHKLMVETSDLNTLALSDKEYILANGNQDDADKLWAIMKGKATPVPGEVISATASVIQLAVSPDAKEATPKYADFIVNLKTPLADKDIPAAGSVYGIQPATELDGTYDSYTQVAATDTSAQTAQIVLTNATIVPEKKKTVPVHHPAAKPSAAHKPAAN
jgi:hypothetical protein